MLARVAIAAVCFAAGCWTKTPVPGPPSWRAANAADVLPDGAWLVAALDLELDSPAQLANEAKARRDPKAVRNPKGGCQFPSTHFAVAMYGDKDVVVASRGGYHRRALLACFSDMARGHVNTTSIDGMPTIEVRSTDPAERGFALTATDHGMVVGATTIPLLARAVATRASAMADPKLEALVREARSRGELWIAARVPRGSSAIRSMLELIGVDAKVRVTAVVGALRIHAPFGIDIAVEVEGGAAQLAAALEQRRRTFGALIDPDLAPIVDAIQVRADGNMVRLVGAPPNIDIWKAFQGLMRTVSNLKG